VRLVFVSVAMALSLGARASAQDGQISARDRQSAAEAYDRGTSAVLARDYERAGQWFETAHRLAPAAAALVEAARSYERAGNTMRAATIGLRLQELYPNDRAAARAAERVLRGARAFVRVDVTCDAECTLQVDGVLMEQRSFFVSGDGEHTIEAAFEHGTERSTVRATPGEQRSLSFNAPAAPAVPVEPEPADPVAPIEPQVTTTSSGLAVVPFPVTIGGMVLTVAAGAVLIWSGVDAIDGVPAYEMNPTREALADGQMRELRTNVMIGVTSGLAAITLLLAIFTDWGTNPPVEASAMIQPDGAFATLRGRF
jgi:hypothetical protein